jgi:hypothetical protein
MEASHGIDLSAALSYNRLLCGANREDGKQLNKKLWLPDASLGIAFVKKEWLAPLSGKVFAHTAPRHRHQEWLAFLRKIDKEVAPRARAARYLRQLFDPQLLR